MEATGVYWKPVWAVLEDDFELRLVNARHVKQVPGRKTDVSDAQWLGQLAEAGLLRASFCPAQADPGAARAREANRLHKALEDTGIKLDCVASNILGASGRAMLAALIEGTTDPEVLADLVKGECARSFRPLREALEGRFDELHAVWIGAILAHVDFLDEQIDSLSEAIEDSSSLSPKPLSCSARSRAFSGAQRRRSSLRSASTCQSSLRPSSSPRGPANVRSTTNRRASAARARHTAARGGSTRRSRSPRSRRSTRKMPTSPPSNRRLRPRRGHKKALGAIKHSIICLCWHMLSSGELYAISAATTSSDATLRTPPSRLVAQLEALGHAVTLHEVAADEGYFAVSIDQVVALEYAGSRRTRRARLPATRSSRADVERMC